LDISSCETFEKKSARGTHVTRQQRARPRARRLWWRWKQTKTHEIATHVNRPSEGWDVTNLYTMPPKSFRRRVLTEQTPPAMARVWHYGERTGDEAVAACETRPQRNDPSSPSANHLRITTGFTRQPWWRADLAHREGICDQSGGPSAQASEMMRAAAMTS
jgi:hypothetical protein